MPVSIYQARHFFIISPLCFGSHLKMEAMITGIHRFFNDFNNSLEQVVPDYAVHVSRFPRDAICAIQQFASAVPSGIPLRVYAVGGSGLLFDCLNGVVGLPNVELGIIPCGEWIDFYRVFGEANKEIFNSLEAQTCAPSTPMDALYCGSNYALSHCLIGLEALFRRNTKSMRERRTLVDRCMLTFSKLFNVSSLCLMGAFDSEILRQNYRIWVDDENLSGEHAFITIANSPYYARNKKNIILEADPADGCLDVLLSNGINVSESYDVLSKYVNSHHEKYPHLFTCRRAKKVFLTSSSPLILDLDGEVFYDKYISIEIKPGVVRIIDPTQIRQE
ncbi:MAG: hypothetical protein FWG52_08735 [Proteobacteria bacterium]|nr:hypothetical protein [Pseudomonadota bacterium]